MNSNCPGPVIEKDDGNGAPSGAHPDSKSIVVAHIGGNADFISRPFRLTQKSTPAGKGSFKVAPNDKARGDFVEIANTSETLR